jgi:hypothetical protein
MSFNRTLGNLGKAIDSASAGTFLQRDDATDVDFVSIEYSDLSGTPTALDSAAATNLIDSAYIQLRQGSLGGGGLDSAAVTTLVDSNYVSARTSDLSSGFFMYDYVATAGQTTFQDSDANGNVLSYGNGGILVFYNGILMRRGVSYDYIEGTNSVTLNTAADSAANITISKWTYSGGQIDGIVWGGNRGVTAGGYLPHDVNTLTMDYFDITTAGNASDFGDISTERRGSPGMVSDTSRGVVAAGVSTSSMEYVTISTPANASSFGSTQASYGGPSSHSDGTKGYFVGGSNIDVITIQTAGNASTFGSAYGSSYNYVSGTNDFSRAVHTAGSGEDDNVDIHYFEMVTYSTAGDFGNLTSARSPNCAVGDGTYGVFVGGDGSNILDYVTIQTTSNATDFGDLTNTSGKLAAAAGNATRGVRCGGVNASYSSPTNVMDYFIIATPGNATDLGDLSGTRSQHAATSGNPS